MFGRLGLFVFRRRRLVLAVALVVLVGAGVAGRSAFSKLLTGGSTVPGAPSTLAQESIASHFGGDPNLVFVVHAERGTVNSPAVAAAGRRLTESLVADRNQVVEVHSYWTLHAATMRSANGVDALVSAYVEGSDQQQSSRAKSIIARSVMSNASYSITAGGPLGVSNDVRAGVSKSLTRAELIAVPLTLVLLLVVFASAVAALLPLAIGLLAAAGTFALLDGLASLTSVSVYAVNLTTALGLALGIDYALLGVGRFREELAAGRPTHEAVVRTVETAGRTIVFSAATVAVALGALLMFPLYFLRSFAYAGIGVVVIAAVGGVLVLPALLGLLGPRVNRGRLGFLPAPHTGESKTWRRLAGLATRRAALVALPAIALLVALASLLVHASFANPDATVLSPGTPSRVVADTLARQFPADDSSAIDVVTLGPAHEAVISNYGQVLSRLANSGQVQTSAGTFDGGRVVSILPAPGRIGRMGVQQLAITMTVGADSGAAQHLVTQVRALAPPGGLRVLVGGPTAALVDTKHAIATRLPLAGGVIALTTFVLLFLFTGSVIQPIRALLSNALGLAAVGGVMVWVFQDGHLSSLLGFTPGPLDTSMPVLVFCIAFGLSMDYELFVISRVKERHDAGATTQDAAIAGLAKSGRIVTTAAALMAITFFAFATSSVRFVQFFGLATSLAILLDATVLRGILLPASLRLLGEHSWYAPRLARRLHSKLHLSEADLPAT